jgi:GT2 family glycosyltransferase
MSFVALISDAVRRARYRRADLRRVSPIEMVPGAPSSAFTWLSDVRVNGRSAAALACPCDATVSYEVTLPRHALVMAWCAVEGESDSRDLAGVEFQIDVRLTDTALSARVVPSGRPPRRDHQWHALSLAVPEGGAARISLTTRAIEGGAVRATKALWGDPRVESRRPLNDFVSALRSALAPHGMRRLWQRALPADSDRLYRLWVREHEPSRAELRAQREWSAVNPGTFTFITDVADAAVWHPDRAGGSLMRQTCSRWEWIIVAAEDAMQQVREALVPQVRDPRVRLLGVPAGSSRADAWNAAWRAASGEFAALLGQDDELSPTALYEIARSIEQSPDVDVVYSDEDAGSAGTRRDPRFKPAWSPELLLSLNYIGRLAVIRVAAATVAGGFRRGFEGAEEWDLFLRLSAARIRRVPLCLYHRHAPVEPEGEAAAAAALRSHWERRGVQAAISTCRGLHRSVWPIQGEPLVSVIIPNRDAVVVLRQCLSGLLDQTNYTRLEVVIVDNGSTDPEVLDLYRALSSRGRGRVLPFDRPFNFSAACNAGAADARGELLLFLNNDIEVIEPDWLAELIRWAQLPDVGIVGAKLLYPDRTIQHAGVVFGLGLVGHIFSRAPEHARSVFGAADGYRNYLAVTGACQMLRTALFRRMGGFDERFHISFSDVVLCMETLKAGYRTVYTPHARLVHHESYTRKRDDSVRDMELLARYLRDHDFDEDPYFHPELNSQSSLPAVRPPFDPAPRQVVHDYINRVLATAR